MKPQNGTGKRSKSAALRGLFNEGTWVTPAGCTSAGRSPPPPCDRSARADWASIVQNVPSQHLQVAGSDRPPDCDAAESSQSSAPTATIGWIPTIPPHASGDESSEAPSGADPARPTRTSPTHHTFSQVKSVADAIDPTSTPTDPLDIVQPT